MQRLDVWLKRHTELYYANMRPFGKNGDFITAPMVSQLFGETIAVWLQLVTADWPKVALLELGPGDATMMSDILRVYCKQQPEKLKTVYLLEQSPQLRAIQQKKLAAYNVVWLDSIDQLATNNIPLAVVTNEFFDALPMRQFIEKSGIWHEVFVNDVHQTVTLPSDIKPPMGYETIYELSEESITVMQILAKYAECILAIDYGYFQPPGVSTLQAISRHQMVPIFSNFAQADITYLVDFIALARALPNWQVQLMTQQEFLNSHGINLLGEKLINLGVTEAKVAEDISRLTDNAAMGDLFKVLIANK